MRRKIVGDERLLTLLEKKRGFFEAILELSENEAHLPLHEWIGNLEKKKILLACIDEVDLELERLKGRFQHLTQETDEMIQHIHGVVEKILHLDRENQEKRKKELLAVKKYE